MLPMTTEATFRAYEGTLLAWQGAIDACRRVMRAAGALDAAASRPAPAGPTYLPPGAPASGPAARVARVLDEAHAGLPVPELAALLLGVRGAARHEQAVSPLPLAARTYQGAIDEALDAPGAGAPDVRASVVDYTEQVAARPRGAGAPQV